MLSKVARSGLSEQSAVNIIMRPSSRQLIVPRVRRSTFGARAFAIAGPTVWNSLPDSLRDPAVGLISFDVT